MKELTSANVDEIFNKVVCEDTNPNFKRVEMVDYVFGVDMVKLKKHRQDVKDMLSQLPKEFFPVENGGGGGWSFLQAYDHTDDVQWTDVHLTMEALLIMGMALDMVKFMMPREMWWLFPGNIPYIIVDPNGIKHKET